jgi:hypothetical protein
MGSDLNLLKERVFCYKWLRENRISSVSHGLLHPPSLYGIHFFKEDEKS